MDYVRIGTTYYKTVRKPLAPGDAIEMLVPWSTEYIKQDHGKAFLSSKRYDGFCIVPGHLAYKREIENFHNRYHPFPHCPQAGYPQQTLLFLNHIFGIIPPTDLSFAEIIIDPVPGEHAVYGDYFVQGKNRRNELAQGGFLFRHILIQYDDENNEDNNLSISGGLFYRWNDALIPVIKLDYKKLRFGFSYDVNVSKLNAASKMMGGQEITITCIDFLFNKITPCPEF